MFNCEKHDKHKEPFAIRIYIDDFVIFQYIMQRCRNVSRGRIPLVQSKVSVVLGIKISYGYKDLCLSFKIITSLTNATCLEKGTILFTSNNCFIKCAREYFKR